MLYELCCILFALHSIIKLDKMSKHEAPSLPPSLVLWSPLASHSRVTGGCCLQSHNSVPAVNTAVECRVHSWGCFGWNCFTSLQLCWLEENIIFHNNIKYISLCQTKRLFFSLTNHSFKI